MSTSVSLLQTAIGAAADVQFWPLVRGIASLTGLAALILFFKPLLIGIVRALVLVVKPRLTREERIARAHMQDAQVLRRMINSSQCPSHADELRAMASRA